MEHYTRFADPLVDWTFKRIFGTEQYKDATIGLLNSLITDRQVRDVSFLNVEIPGLTGEDRKSYIDVLCEGDDGSTFIVEMQIAKHSHFRERTVLYASTVISHKADRGDSYDYDLKPTYVVAVIDFELPHPDGGTAPESCITHYCTQDSVTGEKLPGAPEYFFLELKRFKKKVGELSNIQEKFLFLLCGLKELEDIPDGFGGNRAFDAFFQAAETANFTKKERMLYDQAMVTKTDIIYMKRESFEEGRAEGIAEGIAEGEARGRSAGVVEGEANTRREVAKKMLADGLDAATIAKYTGFSKSEIENLF